MRAIKLRIYPNREQKIKIDKSLGCVRFVYNRALALKKSRYDNYKDNLSIIELSKMVTFWKKTEELSFLKEANAQSLQQALRHLDTAYNNFFKKRKRFPAFKKKSDNQGYSVVGCVKIFDSKIQFPKLGLLKIKGLRKFKGKIKTATLSKNRANQYFISFCIDDVVKKEKTKKIKSAIGIDVGIKSLATTSDGLTFSTPNTLKKMEEKLKYYQRRKSKCIKGSRSFTKWKYKIAVIWNNIVNTKNDYLHKLSNRLVKNHDLIVIENLKIDNMVGNRKFSKAINNMSWGEFFRQLEYKSEWYGKYLLKVNPRYTSQKCSFCNHINSSLTLSDRYWNCPNCYSSLDRDLNASINIKNKGMDSILKSCGDIFSREVYEARTFMFNHMGCQVDETEYLR